MIIAFYPGTGGNRYFLHLQGKQDFLPRKSYDQLVKDQNFVYRYLDATTQGLDDQEVILSHCMNVPLIQQTFPNQKQIIILLYDLDKSLKREFAIEGQFRQQNMNDKVEIKEKLEHLILNRLETNEPVFPFGDYFCDENFTKTLKCILSDNSN